MTSIILILLINFTKFIYMKKGKGYYLGDLTWLEAEKLLPNVPIIIIPFGAGAKEHGFHLPMNTDRKTMEYLLDVAVEHEEVIVVPPILHGWFPAFRDYPGTEIFDANVFQQYVYQVAMSMVKKGAKRILFLNTGIFLASGLPIAIAAREIRVENNVPTLVVSHDDLETDEIQKFIEQKSGGHADEIETSIYLYLDASKVKMDLATKDYRKKLDHDYAGYLPGLFSRNINDPDYSTCGNSGDPRLATAEKGEKILNIIKEQWLKTLRGFAISPLVKK